MTPRCPWCNSTAQVKEGFNIERRADEQTLYIDHYCICGCGTTFVAKEKIVSLGYTEIEPIPREDIERRLRRQN